MTHISLDLETWGTRPGCDIRSIGAVVFDPVAGSVTDDTFYVATDNPFSASVIRGTGDAVQTDISIGAGLPRRYKLHRDPETVKWWSDQSDEAQAAFDNPFDLKRALMQFIVWLNSHTVPETQSLKLWANDPHFDVSILAEAYHAVGLPVPWHYRAPRSMRTVVDLSGLTRDEYVTHGTAHNALDDAIAQAWTICKCYERLGLVG